MIFLLLTLYSFEALLLLRSPLVSHAAVHVAINLIKDIDELVRVMILTSL